MLKTMTVRTTIAAILAGLSMSVHAIADSPKAVDIPAGDLRQALLQVSEQFGTDLVFNPVQVQGLKTGGASGELTTEQAVTKLLEGTPLELRTDPSGAMLIAPSRATKDATHTSANTERSKAFWSRLRLAQSDTPSPSQGEGRGEDLEKTTANQQAAGPAQPQERVELEEIVVTGTHIRDSKPVSPVSVYTRENFEDAGASTAEQFLATLPQNFGGTESGDTQEGALASVQFDPGIGSGVNLRGLGSAATLVLVDGRRLAPGGLAAYGDVSMIPLAAVERIEVMTDGASALYGSDAVGGVVNFILRKDFSGAETGLRYGDSTSGGLEETQASQVLGTQWGSGNALLSYDFRHLDPLDRSDRDFSRNATGLSAGPRSLIPGDERHSFALFAKQELSERMFVSANGLHTTREGEAYTWDRTADVVEDANVDRTQFGGGVGFTMELTDSWWAQVDGSYNESELERTNQSLRRHIAFDSNYKLWSTDAKLSGELISLPLAAVKMAVGAGYREEMFDYSQSTDGVPTRAIDSDTLSVSSAYVEISIPVGESRVGGSGDRPLLVSLAGRYEDYSTFGSTMDPKVGLRWNVFDAVSLYASYGRSFKAPSLYQTQENAAFTVNNVSNVADPQAPTGTTRALVRGGNNSELSEETARSLTAGMEFRAQVGTGLSARLNYFDIEYKDRIQGITAAPAAMLRDAAYGSAVTRRGEMSDADFNALIAEYLSGSRGRILQCPVAVNPTTGTCATSPTAFNAIIDRSLQNFVAVRVSGIDLELDQAFQLGLGELTLGVYASYFLKFDQDLDPATPSKDIRNTLYNPVDLRLRSKVKWTQGGWSAVLAANYVDSYSTEDAVFRLTGAPMPLTNIASWTTIDLTLSHRTGSGTSWLSNVTTSLSALNLFDKDPPFVDDQWLGLGYDPANADPRGRFISVFFSKSW